MNIATRSAALATLAAAALTGCSASSPTARTAPPVQTSTVQASSVQASTVQASKAVALATSAPASAPATPPAAAPATPGPATAAAQPQGALTAKVTILGAGSGLVPGGPAVRFRVTVTNRSAQTYSNVLPLVSLAHCSCTASTLFPAGTLAERESTTNVWPPIPYDVEGFGTDYLKVSQPGGIQLISPGGVATFEYRVALKPASSAQVTGGQGAIDVTLITLPGHTPIGQAPSASAPVSVQAG
jgi:hypothetical protein